MAAHEFAWDPEPLEFRVNSRIERYAAAARCKRCGLRCPCWTEDQGKMVLEVMLESVARDGDSEECNLLVVEGILFG